MSEEVDEQRAGCPAISVPFRHTPDGLPIGIQLVAPHALTEGQREGLLADADQHDVLRAATRPKGT